MSCLSSCYGNLSSKIRPNSIIYVDENGWNCRYNGIYLFDLFESLNWFTVLSFASRGEFIAERSPIGKGRGGNSKQYWWVMLGALKQEHRIELMPVHLARTARRYSACGGARGAGSMSMYRRSASRLPTTVARDEEHQLTRGDC